MEIKFFSVRIGQDNYKLEKLFQPIDTDMEANKHRLTTYGDCSYEIFYKHDGLSKDTIRTFLKSIASKTERLKALDEITAVMNHSIEHEDKKSWGYLRCGFQMNGDTYYFWFDRKSRLRIEDIKYVLDLEFKDIPKSFWRGVLQNINLAASDRGMLMELMRNDRVDIFRIINKRSDVQLTKEELKELIQFPHFTRVTYSGLIGNRGDTADIVNRRAVIMHQDACDDDIVLEIMNGFNTGYDKDSFMKSLSRKSVVEKFKDSPAVQLLTKLS